MVLNAGWLSQSGHTTVWQVFFEGTLGRLPAWLLEGKAVGGETPAGVCCGEEAAGDAADGVGLEDEDGDKDESHQGVYPRAIRYCTLFQSSCDQLITNPRLWPAHVNHPLAFHC
jgi:hypothetical protein